LTIKQAVGWSSLRNEGIDAMKAMDAAVRLGMTCGVLLLAAQSGSEAWGQVSYATPYTFTTVAGSPGQMGVQDGTNGAARFSMPRSLALDSLGRVYVGDSGALRLVSRSVSGGQTNWIVKTVAGKPYSFGIVDGTNSGASFSGPPGLAVDKWDNIYATDSSAIRRVTVSVSGGQTNWVVTTIAGSPYFTGTADGVGAVARFNSPLGIAVDSTGNLYVADYRNHTIRLMVPSISNGQTNWVVSTIAGQAGNPGSADGIGTAAQFNYPAGLAVDSAGNLYVMDPLNYTVRKITPAVADGQTNWVVTTLAGSAGVQGSADGTGSAALFFQPSDVTVDHAGNIFVTDSGPPGQVNTGSSTVRKIAACVEAGQTNWVVSTLAGSPGNTGCANGTGSTARFLSPRALAVDPAGNLLVSDAGNCTIRMGWPALPTLVLSAPVITDSQVRVDFCLNYEWSSTFELLQSSRLDGPWSSSVGAVLSTNVAGVTYSFTAPLDGGIQLYRVHTP
jgi:secreted PhoX family phosphatase